MGSEAYSTFLGRSGAPRSARASRDLRRGLGHASPLLFARLAGQGLAVCMRVGPAACGARLTCWTCSDSGSDPGRLTAASAIIRTIHSTHASAPSRAVSGSPTRPGELYTLMHNLHRYTCMLRVEIQGDHLRYPHSPSNALMHAYHATNTSDGVRVEFLWAPTPRDLARVRLKLPRPTPPARDGGSGRHLVVANCGPWPVDALTRSMWLARRAHKILHARAKRAQAANTTTNTNKTAGRHGIIPPGNASLELLPPVEPTDWAQAVRNQSVELSVARVGQCGHTPPRVSAAPLAPLHSMLAACVRPTDGAPDARGGCAEYTVSWRVLWCAGGGGEGSRVAAEAAYY